MEFEKVMNNLFNCYYDLVYCKKELEVRKKYVCLTGTLKASKKEENKALQYLLMRFHEEHPNDMEGLIFIKMVTLSHHKYDITLNFYHAFFAAFHSVFFSDMEDDEDGEEVKNIEMELMEHNINKGLLYCFGMVAAFNEIYNT